MDSDKPSSVIPSYMRSQTKTSSNIYERMSDDDWKKLEKTQQLRTEEKNSSRHSSVHFDESQSTANATRSSISSILKPTTAEPKQEIDDTVRSIRQKCQDVMGNMKLESILEMLCERS